MNNNPLLRQVLGGVLGQAMARRGMRGGRGASLGGGLGGVALASLLGGMLRGRRSPMGLPARGGGSQAAILMLLLPLAMRWVQRQGGMGAVLERFRQQGYGRQAQSWLSTADNQPLDPGAVEQVVGHEELRAMAQRLGVPEQEVAQAFAEIMPQMVDQLSPEGQVPQQADEVLDEGRQVIEREIEEAGRPEPATAAPDRT